MNKAKLKSYAPQARKDFIAAVTARANLLGLSEKMGKPDVAASQPQGGVTVIAGQAWPVKVHGQRQQLIARIRKDGFAQTMEAVAYTWFNRIAALRYMELHDYLGHGYRALSSLEGTLPDILTHAQDLTQDSAGNGGLPGLKPELVVEMKLAGNRDGELYRLLLVAQCNALSNVMPFLFEHIDDETELLLPDNLLRTDSVIAKLVASIPEEDWKEVEIIGWLYQFYIAEEKERIDRKIKAGSPAAAHEIPAKTQLFTPNWIVQYLVQNSVGRLWQMANPASSLRHEWPYYITPVGQSSEVQVRLDALVQSRVKYDGGSLNPETITMLDPACGSGHILVEAYRVFKSIYLERGYQPRTIPRLILEKNLYGLDIDDRAAQMAGFALMMKARADDRHLFKEPLSLHVMSIKESAGLDSTELVRTLQAVKEASSSEHVRDTTVRGLSEGDLFPASLPQRSLGDIIAGEKNSEPADATISVVSTLVNIFANAKTLGALIRVPPDLGAQLSRFAEYLQRVSNSGDLYAKAAAQELLPLLAQAQILAMEYDAVVANPPYLGTKGMNSTLKDFAKDKFPRSKSDLFAMFLERGFWWCKPNGINSMVTMQGWMFLSSLEAMRSRLLREKQIYSLVQIGINSFPEMNSKIAQACCFTIGNSHIESYVGNYINLSNARESEDKSKAYLSRDESMSFVVCQEDFNQIPGSLIAYKSSYRALFSQSPLSEKFESGGRCKTHNDELYVRFFWEIDFSSEKWLPYEKGGDFRKWYGNLINVIDWSDEARNFYLSNGGITQPSYWNRQAITWSAITTAANSFRLKNADAHYSSGAPSIFPKDNDDIDLLNGLGICNSNVSSWMLEILSPTINANPGSILKLPSVDVDVSGMVENCINLAKVDWDSFEISRDFQHFNLLGGSSLADAWAQWSGEAGRRIQKMKDYEHKINTVLIDAFNLRDEIEPEVAESRISLNRADRAKDCQRLISYSIGCMMGRYSLDAPGLIYAKAGNVGFDASRYTFFPADADGIVPLTDELWFEDEAASRIREFLLVVWGVDTLAENMAWLAESLGAKAGETPDETIRRYLADKFYKDHLQTYKKRPIYWLFSSGKQGAFQALVYLHRYHEGTLSRMRAEYVVPLTGKIQSRIDMLEKDAAVASSTAARNKLSKEVEKLKKKHVELLAYDEQLRHYADTRITLDLDDGVKVNYGKFGDLLAEVKAVTGGSDD
ncbi:BREX-1 system adenine-specific DNA-methyltransferase PglX [Massilia soli]|uniref:site-specific DNA-methyltransferase (adenine-specific) n=1 Tax=Massilia soli TaxID=2792854 RepID=A0ABS7SKE5_9BURK|nr:BREX-1 system adenine-specific DNA-methyltransferase PglX [Massilia soli]MBZ2206502.1 BREX-1 system adenine-specific DNA-methyltransferase PglX [Massilia soli]